MVRATAQILVGLMLLFGVVTLAPRCFFHAREKNIPRALSLLAICLVMLFFAILSFHYAYWVIRG
jgi:uncharacterized membrane protein